MAVFAVGPLLLDAGRDGHRLALRSPRLRASPPHAPPVRLVPSIVSSACSSTSLPRGHSASALATSVAVAAYILRRRRPGRGRSRCHTSRVACRAFDSLASGVSVRAACGSDVWPLALERGLDADSDKLVVLCQRPGSSSPACVDLQRGVGGGWVGEDGAADRLHLSMADEELSRALLPKARALHAECAPSWPREVVDALDPWPLRGPGTLVFNGSYFSERLAQRVSPGKGLFLFPGAAEKLRLPTAVAVDALGKALDACESLAAQLLGAEGAAPAPGEIAYGELLARSDAVRTGVVDFSRRHAAVGERRRAQLEPQAFGGFGLEYVPRTWARGAALRALEPGGEAECAGCREGDIVVSVDGRSFLEAPLSDVRAVLADGTSPLDIEVEQAAVQRPFYIREASTLLMRELGGEGAEDAALELVPSVQRLLHGRAGESLHFEEHRPMVFAGDGGSASRLHADQQHRVQFCHMMHGVKLFALDTSGSVGTGDDARASGYNEVALPVDLPLPSEQAAWLRQPHVSVAAAGAGDIFCFWGGDRHCGANALSFGPSVALFHSCSKKQEVAA